MKIEFPKSRIFPPVAWLLTTLLLVAAGCSRSSTGVAAAPPAVPVQTAVAVRQDVPRRIESIGSVQSLRMVAIKSQVDGIIAQIHFREGEEVKAGELLVTLDRRPFENNLRIASADLANARAEAARAATDASRYTQLNQQDAISKEQFAQLLTRAETTRAQVQAKEAAVANADLQLGYSQIHAPIAGRTGQRLLHEGALVKANDNNFTLVTVNQLAPIAVAYAVPERTLEEIRSALAGSSATVTVTDRSTGATRENGRLEFVDNTVDPSTGMITLKAVFDNDDQALWPGRFVYVVTQTGVDHDAIVVPTTAVMNSQNGSTAYVVRPDSTVELRKIKIARTSDDNTLIAEGVKAGETVVTDGQLRLLPGMKVESRPLAMPAAKPAAESAKKN